MSILVGCDPELFVKKDGVLVSGHGLIPGTKRNPHPVNKGAVQVDGMALEFNTVPASSKEEFLGNIESVMRELANMVPGHELVAESVAHFGLDFIKKQPKEAVELGCDPDYCAYTGQPNPRPDAETPFRTASGHIHIGWTEGEDPNDPSHFHRCIGVAKQMDVFLGTASVLFDPEGATRRDLYGKAGCFRPKPYGMEYRTLSNKWLKNKPLIEFVYDRVIQGMEALMKGKRIFEKIDDIEECINTSNRIRAAQISCYVGTERELKHVLQQG